MFIGGNDRISKIVEAPGTTAVQVRWDPSIWAGDKGAGFAMRPGKEGGQDIVAAWSIKDYARDKVVQMQKGSAYERALVSVFAEAVARNEAALAALQSNYPLDAKYEPKNGTFDFVFDRPGTEADLRYVGVLQAAPAPIRDILAAAVGFRRHI